MRRAVVATLAAAWIAVTVSLFSFASNASATALPASQCSTSTNVVLAVDFAHWGGPIVRACGSTPTTAFQLLNQGSFHTVGTQHDGPAFICRIGTTAFNGDTEYPRPTEPGESCGPTPPASGYWSSWYANPGQNTWSYSQVGAMGFQPKPGSVELWVFGATSIAGTSGSGVPQYSPDTVRARNSAPTHGAPASTSAARTSHTAPKPSTGPAHTTSSTSRRTTHANKVGPTRGPTSPSTTHTASTPAATARTQTTGTSSTSASATVGVNRSPVGTDSPKVVDATAVAARPASSGSAWPVVIAVGVIAGLAGAAGVTVLRRRSSG